jgi:hypothetical protein
MAEAAPIMCRWCERQFRARRAGSPQRFCGAKCRIAYWTALRRWGERAIAAGILTIADLRNGAAEACTLIPGAVRSARVAPAPEEIRHPHRAPRETPESLSQRQQDFERLLAETIALRRR